MLNYEKEELGKFITLGAIAITLSLGFSTATKAEEYSVAVQTKLESISAKYPIGAQLSTEDAMFIAGNLEKANILSKKTKGFNKTKSKGRHTTKVAGTYYSNLKATSGSFDGDFTTTITTKTNAKSLKSSISHTSYGLRASKSLFVLYKGSINRSCSNLKKCTFDNLKTYSGIPVYANTFAKSTVISQMVHKSL